ncbi:hypothetical protein K3U93_18690 [Mycobacterium malmoense]|uniref:PE-PGRS family protein n=1 Tax=Mycobacterium malmoense TaxID=1780 RepID=A0ABX3SRK3_MYCMA|nr:hypothetical protein [Mycobacterium malmoense]ORA82117.1 hypothetical protein BST29_13075 [Mycobacterium malmoense]QZA16660.1 hypothetical protein K3U93_18690 [Mycobacterium malmoense]
MVVDLAARPHITATVALASAAVLAAGPMAQCLPDPHLAQQRSRVSVSDIRLTGVADSVIDLLAGVENDLASLASGGATAAAVPAGILSDVALPFQTWLNTFSTAGSNLEYLFGNWTQVPFPVLQQIAANGFQYGIDYVKPFQGAATHMVNLLPQLGKAIQQGIGQIAAGDLTDGVYNLLEALNPLGQFATSVGLPLFSVLGIPAYITQNFANATKYLTSTTVTILGGDLTGLATTTEKGFAAALQAVYNSWTAGDLAGTISNVANIPGATAFAFLNGYPKAGIGLNQGVLSNPAIPGTLGPPNGLLNGLLHYVDPGLTNSIVAPNAQNILGGGSLLAAAQNFAYQLTNGWPSLTPAISTIAGEASGTLTSMLQSLPSVLASLPSTLGTIATQIGTMIINLLRML